jgi:hypothetical protein
MKTPAGYDQLFVDSYKNQSSLRREKPPNPPLRNTAQRPSGADSDLAVSEPP